MKLNFNRQQQQMENYISDTHYRRISQSLFINSREIDKGRSGFALNFLRKHFVLITISAVQAFSKASTSIAKTLICAQLRQKSAWLALIMKNF